MRAPQGDKPAYAVNWRSIILADAAIGVGLLVVAGVLLIVFRLRGWAITAAVLGVIYLFFNVRRFLRWRYIRREAGLDT